MFDILDKVSGQNQIAKSTVVERFSLERSAQEKDKETDHFPGNSSAFVSFQKKCKPGRLKVVVVFCFVFVFFVFVFFRLLLQF